MILSMVRVDKNKQRKLANPEPLKNILYLRIPENNEDIKQNNSNCKTVTRLIMF